MQAQLSSSGAAARCSSGSGRLAAASSRRLGGSRGRSAAQLVRASTAAAEHVRYVCEVAVVPGKPKVETLLRVLEAQGQKTISPADRQGLHPLAIPLAQQQQQQGGGGEQLTCLLRWPEGHQGMELPVVSQARNGSQVRLLARSLDEYLHRALAEEESAGGAGGPVAAAAGADGASVYAAGALAASGLPSLDAYLTRKAGMFPDVAERLVQAHLDKGDQLSALITSEWYMRNTHFPGWGRPFEFNSQLMARVGRAEESRDVARISLRMPWWSFSDGFAGMRDAAGMSGGVADVRRSLEEADEMSNMPGMKTVIKTEKQQQMEEADWAMNAVAAGEAGWDEVRSEVANRYAAAGLTEVAYFIRAA